MNDTEIHGLVEDQVDNQIKDKVWYQVYNQVCDQALTFYLRGLTKL